MNSRKQLQIGLIGFGVVGEGIYNVLSQTPSINAHIKKVCIKHPDKKRNAPQHIFTTDVGEILNDSEINVVVELIDDADEALKIVLQAFKNKKNVVSANKKMIANNLPQLLELSDAYQVSFIYEGAVCGSIPVIRNLEEYYDNDLLNSFSGIINGSTNYILTKMIEESWAYEHALKQAQDLGFAESNPTLDVEGTDAVNKLTIILKHAYGITENPANILHKGITRIRSQDIIFAQEKSLKIKLVAQAIHLENDKVAAFVLPTFVNATSRLYDISDEYNGVLIGSKLADEQFLYGKGAGRYPTSSAVLSDISALQYDYRYEYRKSDLNTQYNLTDDIILKIYLSCPATQILDTKFFNKIEVKYQSNQSKYIIGDIQLSKLKETEWINDKLISVILVEVVPSETEILFHKNNIKSESSICV